MIPLPYKLSRFRFENKMGRGDGLPRFIFTPPPLTPIRVVLSVKGWKFRDASRANNAVGMMLWSKLTDMSIARMFFASMVVEY